MEKLQEKSVLRYFKAHPHKNPGKSIKTSHNFCIINDRGLLYTLGGLRTTALRNPGGVSEIESSVNENPVGVDSGTGFPKIRHRIMKGCCKRKAEEVEAFHLHCCVLMGTRACAF